MLIFTILVQGTVLIFMVYVQGAVSISWFWYQQRLAFFVILVKRANDRSFLMVYGRV